MKAKTIKARVMWEAIEHDGRTCHETQEEAEFCAAETAIITPVFVLPSTREAYEQMVEQGAEKIAKDGMHEWGMDYYRSQARSVLAALNIKEPKA